MSLTRRNRKLRPPWFRAYKLTEKLSDLSYMLKGVVNGKIAGTLLNHLRRFSKIQAGSEDPMEGLFPDSFKDLRNLLNSRGEGKEREFKL